MLRYGAFTAKAKTEIISITFVAHIAKRKIIHRGGGSANCLTEGHQKCIPNNNRMPPLSPLVNLPLDAQVQ